MGAEAKPRLEERKAGRTMVVIPHRGSRRGRGPESRRCVVGRERRPGDLQPVSLRGRPDLRHPGRQDPRRDRSPDRQGSLQAGGRFRRGLHRLPGYRQLPQDFEQNDDGRGQQDGGHGGHPAGRLPLGLRRRRNDAGIPDRRPQAAQAGPGAARSAGLRPEVPDAAAPERRVVRPGLHRPECPARLDRAALAGGRGQGQDRRLRRIDPF